jgi:hypothetical protein
MTRPGVHGELSAVTILHPTDFSEEADHAEREAARLARRLGARARPPACIRRDAALW